MRTLVLAVFLSLTTTGAFAHGDQVHIGGIITSVSPTAVSIKTADGKTTEVKADQEHGLYSPRAKFRSTGYRERPGGRGKSFRPRHTGRKHSRSERSEIFDAG